MYLFSLVHHCIHQHLSGLHLDIDHDHEGELIEVLDYGVFVFLPSDASFISLYCANDEDALIAYSFAKWFSCTFQDYGIKIDLMSTARI